MKIKFKVTQKSIVILAIAALTMTPVFANTEGKETSCNKPNVVIDSHFHVTSPENWDQSPLNAMGVAPEPVTGEIALELLNNSKVDMAVLVSTAYLFPDREVSMRENDYVAGLVKANPNKFFGLCAITASQDWAMEEIERCVNVLGMNGLKLHLFANPMNLTNQDHVGAIAAVFKKAAEVKPGLPILVDFNWTDDSQTIAFIQLVMANPSVNVIMAHGLGHHYKEFVMVDLMRTMIKGSLNNLYADISATLSTYPPGSPSFDDYIWHLRKMGVDHLLFGSDYPVETPAKSYDAFLNMGFDSEEQKQIQGGNAAKLFGCEKK